MLPIMTDFQGGKRPRWKTNVWTSPQCRESTLLLRPDEPTSCQRRISGTSAPRINATVAP
eukprot:4982827-Pyramimonas_sp.AAC.1